MKTTVLKAISIIVFMIVGSAAMAANFKAYSNFYKCDLPRSANLSWNLAFGWKDPSTFFGVYNTGSQEGYYYKAKSIDSTFFQYSRSGATFTVPNTMLVEKNPAQEAEIGYGDQYSRAQEKTTCVLVTR